MDSTDDFSVSFLIPLFNCKRYVKRCIDSIVSQLTFAKNLEYEIIILNDGSTDGSEGLINSMQSRFSKIILYNQANKGIGYTRQKLLELARYDYVFFIDPDDYLVPDCLSQLFKIVGTTKPDAVYFSFLTQNGIENRLSLDKHDCYNNISTTSGKTFLESVFNLSEVTPIWRFLLRRTSITSQFEEGINFGEDLLFLLEQLPRFKQITTTDLDCYVYCSNPSSISNGSNKQNCLSRSASSAEVALRIDEYIRKHHSYFTEFFIAALIRKRSFLTYFAIIQQIIGGGNSMGLISEFRKKGIYPFGRWKSAYSFKENIFFNLTRNKYGALLLSSIQKILQ